MIQLFFETWVVPAILVLCRLGGVAIFGPILGSPSVPWKVRVFLVVTLAGATLPLTGLPGHAPEPGLGILAGEIAIGAVIGLIASLPMVAAQLGGLLGSQQLGLGFGRFYLPSMDDEGDALEQLFYLFALMLFIAVGGIEQMVLAVAGSFAWIEPGLLNTATVATAGGVVVGLLGAACELGLRVAAPILAVVALESIALGFVGRTMPAINVLSVGFALRVGVGLAILALGIGVIRMAMDGFIDETLALMRDWATGGAR
ncbi:MAG: flagellar biosynthetic protein FliR [Phycisphaeraceae bacterium]|nr:flagellar biosynthetic protein FliR [Phycisphaeraceae bacterium]